VKINKLLLITVVIPTFLSVIYFGIIASDVYISESSFVVRSPEKQSASPLGMILKSADIGGAQEDAYAVQSFIMSRDALGLLNDKLKIKEAFSNNHIDIFSRFNALGLNDSFEAFYKYYQQKVVVELDSSSSIGLINVRAYTADDAYKINLSLLEMSEELVNNLNERARQDMIRFAAREVEAAEAKSKVAAQALASFRNQQTVIDPEKQSTLHLQQIAKMQDELLATRAQIASLQRFTRDNPQLPVLKDKLATLEKEILSENNRVTGGELSLANKAQDYQVLALEREFADRQLAVALSSLEQARNDAQRKQLYLERISQPNKPDRAIEPRRIKGVLATFFLGLVAWGILTILIAGVREHRD
jgi:capsular polysaccharide transport system permease protein